MVTMRTNYGTFTGRSAGSIARREFGRKAEIRNGYITSKAPFGDDAHNILARIIWIEEN